MIIGVPKEIKQDENRVAITPAGVKTLTALGNTVIIEKTAGLGSSITDAEYSAAGAKMVPSMKAVYNNAEMVMKVKEPLPPEYPLFRKGLLMFTYLHLAASEELTMKLLKSGVTGIAYETIQLPDGSLPLLVPMSEVAGRMAIQVGAQCLEKRNGGRGILMSGVPGTHPANVVIVGGGIVGISAAMMAVGMGAQVTILDISTPKLRQIDEHYHGRIMTLKANPGAIEHAIAEADLVVGAVLVAGAKAPKIITKKMVKTMQPGSVIVDVAIDQGGCCETSHVTTHAAPTYLVNGVVHYCVGNMPGAVPRTSTYALTNETLPYAVELAQKGFERAVKENHSLALGVNTHEGCCVYSGVAEAFGLKYYEFCVNSN
ncbi:MAG: alanine dehydrogenase [bacterium]